MHAYITTCSKEKSTILGDIPMIDRYLSERINDIYIKSKNEGTVFFVLSGKYGLLSPSNKIPYYDQILKDEQVLIMTDKVRHQLTAYGITKVTLYADIKWKNYIEVTELACNKAQITFILRKIN